MRCYVAGKYGPSTIARVREVHAALVAAGHTITYDWTTDEVAGPTQAINDMTGVLTADVFVLIAEEDVAYCGAVAELGMALASGIPVYVLGTALDDRCIFLKLAQIRRDADYQTDLIEGQIDPSHAR